METKINKKLPKGQRRQRRSDWQERLPIKPVLFGAVLLLVLALLIVINQSSSTLLSSPGLDVLRSKGSLKIGVDTNRKGLYQNGSGLECDLGLLLSKTVFYADDCVSFVQLDRHTAEMAFEDGDIDLALMSISNIDAKGFLAGKQPFYSEPCVLVCRDTAAPLEEMKIAVLNNTPAHELLLKFEEDVEPDIIVVPSAAYYDMLVLFRANRVDALCMPLSVAETFRDPAWSYRTEQVGTVFYHAVATTNNKVLINLIDELILDWTKDGTLL